MIARLADFLGISIDPNVLVLFVVVSIGAAVILVNHRIGLVVLVLLLGATYDQFVIAFPKVVAAATSLPSKLASIGGAAADIAPLRTCDEIDAILATIRLRESGYVEGDYTAVSPDGYATGAYQFSDDAWHDQGGTGRAMDAPPAEQDMRARAYVTAIIERRGDVSAVPVQWFWPIALDDPAQLDYAPFPEIHDGMTVRQYQQEWLATLAEQPGCATAATFAFPMPLDSITVDELDDPHHDYPAIDIGLPEGTQIYAVTAGTVVTVRDTERNCRDCAPIEMCGIGVTVESADGVRWSYCHGRTRLVDLGDTVTAGQVLIESGNTGHSTGPHLHFGIKVAGEWRCPQPILLAISNGTPVPDPSTLPATGCTY